MPRLVIGAPASGQGKTTVSVGIMAALAARGLTVSPGKVGPDYIDPGYHALATGRPGRNLDPWLVGEDRVAPLLAHAALSDGGSDLSVVEGVMGLFDGRLGTGGESSTAHVARLLQAPVVLVLDVWHASGTVAAAVHGLRSFDPRVNVAGVVLNRVGSPRHAEEVTRWVEQLGLPVLGALPRDAGISVPSRHLGLIPAAERDDAAASLARLAEQTAEHIDLDAVLELARTAPNLDVQPWSPDLSPVTGRDGRRPVVAVAGGRAFSFRYAETEELLRSAGCEVVTFDPAVDRALPAGTAGLYLGGGFPEMHAATLSTNTGLLAAVREAVAAGMPTVAECAGLLYLCREVEGRDFVGAVPATAAMAHRLTLAYTRAATTVDSVLGPAGSTATGHEFHRTTTDPLAGDLAAWDGDRGPLGFALDPAGTGRATLHASYLHVHWAGHPHLAQHFAQAVSEWDASTAGADLSRSGNSEPAQPPAEAGAPAGETAYPQDGPDLLHHGDRETAPDLVDLAVNVRQAAPPAWLAGTIRDTIGDLAAYPDSSAARAALARRHGVTEEMVLPTSGAAEAFTLVARAGLAERALVVHPQFTEPEAALLRAGVPVERHVLDSGRDFPLVPEEVPDIGPGPLVVAGNPTNPTGVLHRATALRAMHERTGGVLMVDEAFLDEVVLGQEESLIGPEMPGVLVVRSLTKTWGLAGLRAGYVVGDPALVARLAEQQPPWSVSTPALAVMEATSTPAAAAEEARLAEELVPWRGHLVAGLQALGVRVVPSQSPFVLAELGIGTRERLRHKGYAVRRGDTFPRLGPQWCRLAVRDPLTTDGLLRALGEVLEDVLEGKENER